MRKSRTRTRLQRSKSKTTRSRRTKTRRSKSKNSRSRRTRARTVRSRNLRSRRNQPRFRFSKFETPVARPASAPVFSTQQQVKVPVQPASAPVFSTQPQPPKAQPQPFVPQSGDRYQIDCASFGMEKDKCLSHPNCEMPLNDKNEPTGPCKNRRGVAEGLRVFQGPINRPADEVIAKDQAFRNALLEGVKTLNNKTPVGGWKAEIQKGGIFGVKNRTGDLLILRGPAPVIPNLPAGHAWITHSGKRHNELLAYDGKRIWHKGPLLGSSEDKDGIRTITIEMKDLAPYVHEKDTVLHIAKELMLIAKHPRVGDKIRYWVVRKMEPDGTQTGDILMKVIPSNSLSADAHHFAIHYNHGGEGYKGDGRPPRRT